MEKIRFQNQDCYRIENKFLELIIAESIGPRILSVKLHGNENILAELPEFTTPLPDGSKYHFWGGHRLWVAPEHMPLTYDHDDKAVEILEVDKGYLITKEVEKISRIQKSIRIKLDPEKPTIHISHQLKNMGTHSIECAAWAITQFRTGGVAILPQSKEDTGLLPNRSFSLWPYSDINEKKVTWGNDYILLEADVEAPFKIGFPNHRGWLGYWIDNTLFVKTSQFFQDESYYDNGSSSECYCNDQFLELETLGPKIILDPGRIVEHKETWELFDLQEQPRSDEQIESLLLSLHSNNL